jgi:hypothetical protein
MIGYAIFGIMVGWVTTTILFVVIPVARALQLDVRAAEAAGLPNARAIARRRFFLPRRPGPMQASLLGRAAWVERYAFPAHEKRPARVAGVRTHAIVFDDGSTFEPSVAARGFAQGSGAAKGVLRDEHGSALPALVVFC